MSSSSNPVQKHTVFLVEPNPIAARHLAAALKRDQALRVIPAGFDLPTDPASSEKSSVVIVDEEALPFPLFSYLRTVRALVSDARILIIGRRASDEELCRLLFHGVKGLVTYDNIDEQLCRAVDALIRGHAWVSPEVLDRYLMLSSSLPGREQTGGGAFSPRESEIIGLLQRRLSDKESSSVLGVSEHTVRFHLENIFNKLGVRDRYSVIELLRTAGLAGPESGEKTGQRARERKPVGSRALQKAA